METYSPIVVDHYTNPRNAGRLADADAIGDVVDPGTDTLVVIYLKQKRGRIERATFRTIGCNACVAASSMATELVIGRTVAEARSVDTEAIVRALGGLPEDKRYCAELVAQALASALRQLGE